VQVDTLAVSEMCLWYVETLLQHSGDGLA